MCTSGCNARSASRCSGWPTRSRRRIRTRAAIRSGSAAGVVESPRAFGCPRRTSRSWGRRDCSTTSAKIGVPEPILRKRGALDAAEWTVMRRHPVTGAQIVAPFEHLAGAAVVIRHHHERCDGSGYPDGLPGAAIPLGARIVAVADVFDALTSERPYRAALPHQSALEHLVSEAGTTLDRDVVEAALAVYGDVGA
ncbi:MAG TPA: HD domain-containing phosphohydrolase [Candidatus Acidoferrum sp.]|nr:HD domain-containing phosphohydrolase [Candidatus Acidoferrum sp.]